ncbi:MAG: AAA family ATPase [Deltaproteobacteria bacterium]|jgi:type II secretory pathway predicted ATPase ExeA|nr:AAA family ATPase [Deltaproteobacteria bacterium]
MDYETFFSLRERPFRSQLSPGFLFRGPAFVRLCGLLGGDAPPPELIVVAGEKGAGKTALLSGLGPPALPPVVRVLPVLRGASTLSGILAEALNSMGLKDRLPPGAPEETLLGFFQNAVSDLVRSGARCVLAVDGAQHLGRDTLSDLPGLMSIEPSWKGRTSLVLCGTPGPGFPGPAAAGAVLVELPPLTLDETASYLAYRLKAAGARRDPFTPQAVAALHSFSEGIPGELNVIAERALMTAWSQGKKEITPAHVARAAGGMSSAAPVAEEAAGLAAGGVRQRRRGYPKGRARIALAAIVAALMVSGWFLLRPDMAGPVLPRSGGRTQASAGLAGDGAPQPSLAGRLTVEGAEAGDLPADLPPGLEDGSGGNVPVPDVTPAAPAGQGGDPDLLLPSPPPALLSLPRNSLVLVVDGSLNMARLWQGSIRGPGLKAEISPPDIKLPGLYLVGRPQSRTPLIFQYPPAREIPKEAGIRLWRQVEPHLPQDILPLMAGDGPDLRRSIPDELAKTLKGRLKSWTQSQEYKLADNMAALYAERFRFFEPGSPDRTIAREQFRTALASELRTSGDVKLTASEPLILLDPRDHGRAWAVFSLKYDSRLRHDLGQRTLIFEKPRIGGEWLITAELWIKEPALAGN